MSAWLPSGMAWCLWRVTLWNAPEKSPFGMGESFHVYPRTTYWAICTHCHKSFCQEDSWELWQENVSFHSLRNTWYKKSNFSGSFEPSCKHYPAWKHRDALDGKRNVNETMEEPKTVSVRRNVLLLPCIARMSKCFKEFSLFCSSKLQQKGR